MVTAFGEFFVNQRKVNSAGDGFLEGFVRRVGERYDAGSLYRTDMHRYEEIEKRIRQGCVRYERSKGVVKPLPAPVPSRVFCDAFLGTQTLKGCEEIIVNAARWMKPLYGVDEGRLMAALALIVGDDVEFACKVFEGLACGCRDVAWVFKLFSAFLRLARAGALEMAGDPVHVVGWIYERC